MEKSTENKMHCDEYPNCIYRIELLEKWREAVDKKMDFAIKLLIANLASGITILLGALIGAIIWIART